MKLKNIHSIFLCLLTIALSSSQIAYNMELDAGFEPSMPTHFWGKRPSEFDRLGAQAARAMKTFTDVLLKKTQDQNQQSIGRKALQVAGHCAKKIIFTPKYLLLTTGIALYASPRLRNATGRFIANRYNAFARQNPNNIFVRAIAGTRSIFNFIVGGDAREQAAREEQAATQNEVRILRTQLEEARHARTTLEERLNALTAEVTRLASTTGTLAGNVTQTREALSTNTITVERILGEINRLSAELHNLQDPVHSPFVQRLDALRETSETLLNQLRERAQNDERTATTITGLQQEIGSLANGLLGVNGSTQEILRRLAARSATQQDPAIAAASSAVVNPFTVVGRGQSLAAGNGLLDLLSE